MDRKRILVVGAGPGSGASYIGLMTDILKLKYDVEFIECTDNIDIQGLNADYFLLDEAPTLDRNLEKLQNMNLCHEVMVPDMFEYVKESPSLRNQNRGYWQKGRW